MPDVVRWLDELGVPSERIRLESFEDAIVPGVYGAHKEGPNESRIIFKTSQKSAVWRRGEGTLLQLAEDAGIRVPSDCRGVICGVCTTRLRAGSVCYEDEPIRKYKTAYWRRCIRRWSAMQLCCGSCMTSIHM